MNRVVSTLILVAFIFPTAVGAQGDVTITPDVVYGHKDGMALTFDVLQPGGSANGAGVIYMVSGGWFSRWAPPERAVERHARLLSSGFTVFLVRHGSSPRYKVPDAAEDAGRAVLYIKLHARDFGVDPDRLGVFGGSAGGHLSLLVGLDSELGVDSTDNGRKEAGRVAAVVAYFPPVDLRSWIGPSRRFPALDFADSLANSVSPILFVSPDDPPTLLIHGDADELVPLSHSERMYSALQRHGVPSKFIVLPGAPHGFRGEDATNAMTALIAWFEEHLN